MSYQISYTPEFNKRYPSKRKRNRRKKLGVIPIAILLLVCLFVAGTHWQSGEITAGKESRHKGTFETMLQEIREGTPFQEAVTAFCKEVLING